jgi:Tfp pilus assembly protein PilF
MIKVSNLLVALLFFLFNSCAQSKSELEAKANLLNKKAVAFIMKDQDDSALIMLDSIIKVDPAYYNAYTSKCTIYCDRKDFKDALIAILKAIEVKPDLAEGWTFAGMISDHMGDSTGASKYYRQSIELYNQRIANPDKKKYLEAKL